MGGGRRRGALRYRTIPAWACRSSAFCVSRKLLSCHWNGPTIEIGICGALGNMNLTSSNLPRLLQFSANDILMDCVRRSLTTRVSSPSSTTVADRQLVRGCGLMAGFEPVAQTMRHYHRGSMLLQSRHDESLSSSHLVSVYLRRTFLSSLTVHGRVYKSENNVRHNCKGRAEDLPRQRRKFLARLAVK